MAEPSDEVWAAIASVLGRAVAQAPKLVMPTSVLKVSVVPESSLRRKTLMGPDLPEPGTADQSVMAQVKMLLRVPMSICAIDDDALTNTDTPSSPMTLATGSTPWFCRSMMADVLRGR